MPEFNTESTRLQQQHNHEFYHLEKKICDSNIHLFCGDMRNYSEKFPSFIHQLTTFANQFSRFTHGKTITADSWTENSYYRFACHSQDVDNFNTQGIGSERFLTITQIQGGVVNFLVFEEAEGDGMSFGASENNLLAIQSSPDKNQ